MADSVYMLANPVLLLFICQKSIHVCDQFLTRLSPQLVGLILNNAYGKHIQVIEGVAKLVCFYQARRRGADR